MCRTTNCRRTADSRQRTADARPTRSGPLSADRCLLSDSRGFTLAGVLVIMTIIAVFVAYTVPKQWSLAMKRDREKQTIFVMKQYARSITAWQTAHGGLPTSLDQLKEARSPRLVRGPKAEWVDPMTGKVDWILIPPQVAAQGTPTAPSSASQWGNAYPNLKRPDGSTGASGATGTTGATDTTGTAPTTKSSPKDYKGPFVGVRPNITGPSYIILNGADQYENWLYTINDLKNDNDAFQRGLAMMAQWK